MLKWGFCCSVTKSYPLCVTPWTAIHQSPLSSTICQSLHKFMSIESVMLSNHLSATLLLLLPSESFPMCQFFAICDQGIEALVSASVLPMSIQDWFPLGLTGLISLPSMGLSRVFSSTSLKTSVLRCSVFFMVQLSHLYMTTGKTRALTIRTYIDKVMSLLFNMLPRFVIAFLPRSKPLLISWQQWPSTVILEPEQVKSKQSSTGIKTDTQIHRTEQRAQKWTLTYMGN